ncbi:MAG TPA: LamG domain-containing protein [Kofleriaceae bacterium]
MRSTGLLVVVAGCGFHATAPPAQDPPPADAGAPDSSDVVLDAGPGSDAMRSTFCAIDGIVACFEFEGDARDGSGNNLDAAATGVSFHPGEAGMAMQVDGSSSATVMPTILDNVDAVTIEAWIRPTQLPANTKTFDLLDVDQQYAFALNDDGTLTCDLHPNPGKVSTTGPTGTVATNQWTHVACTYDGVNTSRIYINGAIAATHTGNGTLGKGGHGIGIAQNYPSGSQLIGLIDQLRLLNIARSTADLCTDAGALCISL